MVNINKNKGGEILYRIAEALPQYKFQAVLGGYQEQVLPQPKNVKILPNGTDMVEVYRSSKMVIVPSKYESWGRVAAEAIVSGLPVIHSDTLGLQEVSANLEFLVFDRDNIDSWIAAIEDVYKSKIIKTDRKTELLEQAEEDKLKFITFVKTIYNDKNNKSNSVKAF